MVTLESLIPWFQIALLAAIAYSLKKIYSLEYKIIDLDVKIQRLLENTKKKK